MIVDKPEDIFDLNDAEVETLRRSALERGMSFDSSRRTYSSAELNEYGLCREAYNTPELRNMGFGSDKVVTSFDATAKEARDRRLIPLTQVTLDVVVLPSYAGVAVFGGCHVL
jgi:hypothetical protein